MADEEGEPDKSNHCKTPLSISGLKGVSLFGTKIESQKLKSFKSIDIHDRDRYLTVAASLDIKMSQTHHDGESPSKKKHLIDRNFGLLKQVDQIESINVKESNIFLNEEKYNLNNNIKDKQHSLLEHSKEKKDKDCDSSKKKHSNPDVNVKDKPHSSKQNSSVFNMKNFIKHSPNSPVKIGKNKDEKRKKKHKDHHKHHYHHPNKQRQELKRKSESQSSPVKKSKLDLTLQIAKKDLNSMYLGNETLLLTHQVSKSLEKKVISSPIKASPDINTNLLIKNSKAEHENVTKEAKPEETKLKLVSTSKENEKLMPKTPIGNKLKSPIKMKKLEDEKEEAIKLEHDTETLKNTPNTPAKIKELKSPMKKVKEEEIKFEHCDVDTLKKTNSAEEKQETKSKGI